MGGVGRCFFLVFALVVFLCEVANACIFQNALGFLLCLRGYLAFDFFCLDGVSGVSFGSYSASSSLVMLIRCHSRHFGVFLGPICLQSQCSLVVSLPFQCVGRLAVCVDFLVLLGLMFDDFLLGDHLEELWALRQRFVYLFCFGFFLWVL